MLDLKSASDPLVAVVTRNGAATIGGTLAAIAGHRGPVLVVDNASCDDTLAVVRASGIAGIEIVALERNIGVAAAYNLARRHARDAGSQWLLLLDQDSRCLAQDIARLHETGIRLQAAGKPVAAVCPTVKSRRFPDLVHLPYRWTGKQLVPVTDPPEGRRLIRVDSTITSGTLYAVAALEAIGGFREGYFIDFVDHECHIRLFQARWQMWWDPAVRIYHDLGFIQKMTPDGLWIEHAPFRYYFMARNMAEGHLRLGGPAALRGVLAEILRHIARLHRYGIRPWACSRYIVKGLVHALRGIDGPLDTGS